MAHSMRTHRCGDLRAEHAGQEVALCGWVAHQRDHGGVLFVDLRDREGIVQVVFNPQESPETHALAERVRGESVVRVEGEVRRRPEGTVNPGLPTGEIEVAARALEVLSEADPPLFPIEDRIAADEPLRLRHRYLDIRRPEMGERLRLRHRAVAAIRRFFDERGFVDVETPMLTRSTPEGARDFLVPSRIQPGTFYALPQSPQLFKQILMVAGLDRYYQIVRCFRDEDLRADRQPEFTQLDVEMSFVVEEDVQALIEEMFAEVWREVLDAEIKTPFPRLPYAEAMRRYGSDKPDLRYGMELADVSDAFRGSGFQAFARVLGGGGVVKGLAAPGAASWSRKDLDGLVVEAQGRGASGLVWIAWEGGQARSPVEKHLARDETSAVIEATGASDGDLMLLVADSEPRANTVLDGLRRLMAARLGLVSEGWAFTWITEPPLFEWSEEEKRWVSVHHPFTSPATDDLKPETAKARAYDVVVNGWELGGGSIRIHRRDVQRKVFDALGFTPEEADARFGFLLEAFRYGVPPHGGIAFGIDRTAMVMAGQDNIREVIAFPKTQSGADLLTGAPAEVDPAQLRELGLELRRKPEEGKRE
ncbi:MAG TPA: aspartate--tRNA ligase [Actinomycetota bacterium]|nr:aspartate--tRNA ligase [Actinomycetota bacterium]